MQTNQYLYVFLGFFGFPNISILPHLVRLQIIFVKKSMQSNFLPKIRIHCIMLYARFLTNFGSRFCKMDIFLFFKNVQNQKPPTNLERPFFGDSKFGILSCQKKQKTKQIYLHITSHFSNKIYLINNWYNIGDDDSNIITLERLIFCRMNRGVIFQNIYHIPLL